MVGEKTVNYAASKMQPSAIAPRPVEIRPANNDAPEGEELKKVEKTKTGSRKTLRPADTKGKVQPTSKPKASAATKQETVSEKGVAKKAALKQVTPETTSQTTSKPKASTKVVTKKKVTAKKTIKAQSTKVAATPKAVVKKKTTPKKVVKATSASSSQKEAFATNHEMFQAAANSGKMNADMLKQVAQELNEYSNQWVSRNMQLSQEFFKCRTLSDMFEIQNKIMKANLDSAFHQSSKWAEMMFRSSGETTAPYNSLLTSMGDAWNKQMVK